jgi:hypothetical protein
MQTEKLTIGKVDKADFPYLELKNIDIKIDTGAYTSSIHCSSIEVVKQKNKKMIKFCLLDPSHKKYNGKEIIVSDFIIKKIKSSNGEVQERFIIKTHIFLFNKLLPIELSLSERGEMKYPVLLGRKLLTSQFIVDTELRNLSYKLKLLNKKKFDLRYS